MAIASFKGLICIPNKPELTATDAFTSVLLDASGEKAAVVLRAPKTGTISKVVWRSVAVTTATDTDVRLETVDLATGDPTGTLLGANSNGTQASASITANVLLTTTLTTGPAVTQGDLFAVVIAPTGTPAYNVAAMSNSAWLAKFPYGDNFLAAAWTKASNALVVGLEYNDGSYESVAETIFIQSVQTNTAYNSGSTPDERGNFFQLPFPVSVVGCWAWIDLDGDCTFKLYDSDGSTVLRSITADKDVRVTATGGVKVFFFAGASTLLANTNYRITALPDTATNVTSREYSVGAVAQLDSSVGGQNWHLTTRTDAGAWTQTTTDRMHIGILVRGFDDGVSAGGGASMVNIGGGLVMP